MGRRWVRTWGTTRWRLVDLTRRDHAVRRERDRTSGEQPGTEAFTRAVLDTLDSRIVVLDDVSRILAVNAAWGVH